MRHMTAQNTVVLLVSPVKIYPSLSLLQGFFYHQRGDLNRCFSIEKYGYAEYCRLTCVPFEQLSFFVDNSLHVIQLKNMIAQNNVVSHVSSQLLILICCHFVIVKKSNSENFEILKFFIFKKIKNILLPLSVKAPSGDVIYKKTRGLGTRGLRIRIHQNPNIPSSSRYNPAGCCCYRW